MGSSRADRLVHLREVTGNDLAIFFEHQLDPVANHMAAFTSAHPEDRQAFMTRWARILADPKVVARTILFNGRVAGHVAKFELFGQAEVTYWLGREFWGLGLATESLRKLLQLVQERPLFARVAKDNTGSLRVLEKCGFIMTGEDRGYANAREEEIEELILRMDKS